MATVEHENSKVDRRKLHADDAYNRIQARAQDITMSQVDPQVGPVEDRASQIKRAGKAGGSSHGTGKS